jgi:hypothetical protein
MNDAHHLLALAFPLDLTARGIEGRLGVVEVVEVVVDVEGVARGRPPRFAPLLLSFKILGLFFFRL